MKVKHLCKEIAFGSIQAGRHPRRWLLDRDESKGGKKCKFIRFIAAVVVLFENAAHLWELDQAKGLLGVFLFFLFFILFDSILVEIQIKCCFDHLI